jgi:hypothetical protein
MQIQGYRRQEIGEYKYKAMRQEWGGEYKYMDIGEYKEAKGYIELFKPFEFFEHIKHFEQL